MSLHIPPRVSWGCFSQYTLLLGPLDFTFVYEFLCISIFMMHCSGGTSGKELTCQYWRHKRCGFDPGSGRSPGGGHGNPLQYSYLRIPQTGRLQSRGSQRVRWLKRLSTATLQHVIQSLLLRNLPAYMQVSLHFTQYNIAWVFWK